MDYLKSSAGGFNFLGCTVIFTVSLSVAALVIILSSFIQILKNKSPKISVFAAIMHFAIVISVYVFAVKDTLGDKIYFKSKWAAYAFFIIENLAITGLYAGILYLFNALKTDIKLTKELCVSSSLPIAVIDEVEIGGKYSDAEKIETGKLGSKKQRLDDSIDYFAVKKYIETLHTKNLSIIEKATLFTCENTFKRYKNIAVSDAFRRELSDALSTLFKLYSKHENCR